MRRLLLHFAIGCLTFLVGTSFSALYKSRATSDHLILQLRYSRPTLPGHQELRIVGGMDACGPEANFHTYDLSDGTRITQSCRRLSSTNQARQELQKLAKAAEIIELQPNLNEKGLLVGERILMRTDAIIELSVSGRSLCETEAPSLDHFRWFQNR
jgi:hypothetical protein